MAEQPTKQYQTTHGLSGNGCAHWDRWNPIRTSAIQSRSRPMRFPGFSNHEKGAPSKEPPVSLSSWSLRKTVCSTFSRSGWSVVRSASLPKGGTLKKRPSPHLHEVPTRSNKVSPRTYQTPLVCLGFAVLCCTVYDLAMDRSKVQRVLTKCRNVHNSESDRVIGLDPHQEYPCNMKVTKYKKFHHSQWISNFHLRYWRSHYKVKLSLCFNWAPRHEGVLGEWRYSSTHSLTSALYGGEWSASRPGRFIPQGKSPWYPLDRRLGGPQSRSGRGGEEKNFQLPPGIEP
jgi:hypothetical protein